MDEERNFVLTLTTGSVILRVFILMLNIRNNDTEASVYSTDVPDVGIPSRGIRKTAS